MRENNRCKILWLCIVSCCTYSKGNSLAPPGWGCHDTLIHTAHCQCQLQSSAPYLSLSYFRQNWTVLVIFIFHRDKCVKNSTHSSPSCWILNVIFLIWSSVLHLTVTCKEKEQETSPPTSLPRHTKQSAKFVRKHYASQLH